MTDVVLATIISGIFALLVAVVSIALPKFLAQGRDLAEVKYQVKNSHGTNLRDDIDALRYEMRHGFHQVHERLHTLENKDG